MKTTIISIPPCAASTALKSLHENNVNCKYVGIDQAGRILMELDYQETQNELIRELIINMQKTEQVVNELTNTINCIVKKTQDEAFKSIEELIKASKQKCKERKERLKEKLTTV